MEKQSAKSIGMQLLDASDNSDINLVIELLQDSRLDHYKYYILILYDAACYGHVEMFKRIIYSPYVNMKLINRYDIRDVAVNYDNSEIVKIIDEYTTSKK